jgi:hypothetical protein
MCQSYQARQEAEVMVPGQSRKNVFKTLSQWKKAGCGSAPVISAMAGNFQ